MSGAGPESASSRPPVIAPDSASYPVHGAALAAGVGLDIAYGWIGAVRRGGAGGEVAAVREAAAIYHVGERRYGREAMMDLVQRLSRAEVEGRLYVPGARR